MEKRRNRLWPRRAGEGAGRAYAFASRPVRNLCWTLAHLHSMREGAVRRRALLTGRCVRREVHDVSGA